MIEKLATGIAGFDFIARGGLPRGRTTLVAGTAGSAKTVFAAQFLAEGVRLGQHGVFVSFEEPPVDVRKNMAGFRWPIEQWEAEGKWFFMDASLQPDEVRIEAGEFDLGALLARIEAGIKKVKAQRIALDSINSIFSQFQDTTLVRAGLQQVAVMLKRLGVTALITAERLEEYGAIARYGVEEFVADNVMILRNVLEDEKRRRTIEILKYRGTDHHKGEFPFTVLPGSGVNVIPLAAIELKQHSTSMRITSGNASLDEMCGGGFFRDSVLLISGATGTGKTLMVTEFLAGGIQNKERCLLFAFEESREQLFRNALGWGHDFEALEKHGQLKIVCSYPETAGLEDHLIRMKEAIEEFKPDRVAVDSISACERISSVKGFREFVIGLTSFIKHHELAGLYTATTPLLLGSGSVTEAHISTITDSIILLRYVELFGEMRRGLTVLKMRGSTHDKDIREFTIDAKGLHVGKPFRNVAGILSGHPQHVPGPEEVDRLGQLFKP